MNKTKGKYTWPLSQWTLLRQKMLLKEFKKSTKSLPKLMDIPDQIMNIILPRLTIKEIVQMRPISHRWNNLAMQHLKTKQVKDSSVTVIVQNGGLIFSTKNQHLKSEEYMNEQFLVDDCEKLFNSNNLVPEIIGETICVKFSKVDDFAQLIKETLRENAQNLILYIVNHDSKVKIKIVFKTHF